MSGRAFSKMPKVKNGLASAFAKVPRIKKPIARGKQIKSAPTSSKDDNVLFVGVAAAQVPFGRPLPDTDTDDDDDPNLNGKAGHYKRDHDKMAKSKNKAKD